MHMITVDRVVLQETLQLATFLHALEPLSNITRDTSRAAGRSIDLVFRYFRVT